MNILAARLEHTRVYDSTFSQHWGKNSHRIVSKEGCKEFSRMKLFQPNRYPFFKRLQILRITDKLMDELTTRCLSSRFNPLSKRER